MRYLFTIWFGKLVIKALRFLGKGATALPGLLVLKLYPDILRQFSRQLKFGSVVITGTNGKTTSARLLADILDRNGYVIVSNPAGSNLERGLVSSWLSRVDWSGKIQADVAVLEIDEAELKNVLDKVNCRELVVTNFFRDQLDRYGELAMLRDQVVKALGDLSAGARLVLNADDQLVASLGQEVGEGIEVVYFGMNFRMNVTNSVKDVFGCMNCGGKLVYDNLYLGHLGIYRCDNCTSKRPDPECVANGVEIDGMNGTNIRIRDKIFGELYLKTNLPGLYNVYNVLAVVACLGYFEIEPDLLLESLIKFRPVFGRGEKVTIGDRDMYLLLAKNPTGMNELIRTITTDNDLVNVVFILNDNIADGTDVSWVWDVDFELLSDKINWMAVSGKRAEDGLNRMKYAGFDMNRVGMQKNYNLLIDDMVKTQDQKSIYVLATYTGMLEFRKELVTKKLLSDFWLEETKA